jgi:hypothetical protein
MFWFGLGVLVVLLVYAAARARTMGPLFTDDHLLEVAALLPELKRSALAGPPESPATASTALLHVSYSIADDAGAWTHHVSVSSPVTPARAAGTFFLGLVRGVLRLDVQPKVEVFVSQNHVFHLITRLSPDEHAAFAALRVPADDAMALRAAAIAGRAALLPRLTERAVKLPSPAGAKSP